jgi:hypothetical protein
MKFLIFLLLWCILFAISWPIAIAALVLLPILWLIALPFRLLFVLVEAVFALICSIVLLPARLFGYKRSS